MRLRPWRHAWSRSTLQGENVLRLDILLTGLTCYGWFGAPCPGAVAIRGWAGRYTRWDRQRLNQILTQIGAHKLRQAETMVACLRSQDHRVGLAPVGTHRDLAS